MTTNRSAEELEMRRAVEAWGRARWPGARLVHELVVGRCRIDMAFIGADHLAGVEIKSGRDVIDRLDPQLAAYRAALPEVWVCAAQRWDGHSVPYGVGRLWIGAGGAVSSRHPQHGFPISATPERSITVPMLGLLWQSELFSLAIRHGLPVARRTPIHPLIEAIARRLTGDEIVAGVCSQLRARDAFPKNPPSDPPVRIDGAISVRAAHNLFRSAAP